MSLVDVPDLREFQQLAGAAGVHLLVIGLLQQRSGVFRHLIQDQEPLPGHLLAQVHERGVHLLGGNAGEMGIQQVAQLGQHLCLHRQRRAHQLAFHPVIRQHHHSDEAARVHGDQLEPLHCGRRPVIRHGVGGVAHEAGHHLPRLVDF